MLKVTAKIVQASESTSKHTHKFNNFFVHYVGITDVDLCSVRLKEWGLYHFAARLHLAEEGGDGNLTVKVRKGWRRFWHDLHVAGGFYTLLVLLEE